MSDLKAGDLCVIDPTVAPLQGMGEVPAHLIGRHVILLDKTADSKHPKWPMMCPYWHCAGVSPEDVSWRVLRKIPPPALDSTDELERVITGGHQLRESA